MTDILSALRQVRASGNAPEALREQLKADGLIQVRGGAMLRWLSFDLTPLGLCDLLRLGAEEAKTLGLRLWTNDAGDTVIAASPDDASAAFSESCGDSIESLREQEMLDWEPRDDGTPFAITVDEGEGSPQLTVKTAAEWAAWNGRGFLCSTEY